MAHGYFAAVITAASAIDTSYRKAAEAHAQMTMGSFNREDNTQFHAVKYETATGERLRGFTSQGAHDDSYWSRGTGKAIMALTVSAANSGDVTYLDQAIAIFEKWFDVPQAWSSKALTTNI